MHKQFTKGSSVVDLFGLNDGPFHAQNFSAVLTFGSQLDDFLNSFNSLFLELCGLPPSRDLCHHIVLALGTDPVVVRLYHYPHAQKEKIEKQCREMLTKGLIFLST